LLTGDRVSTYLPKVKGLVAVLPWRGKGREVAARAGANCLRWAIRLRKPEQESGQPKLINSEKGVKNAGNPKLWLEEVQEFETP